MYNLIYGQLLKALALCLYLILFSNSNYWICITCTILLLIDFFSHFFPRFLQTAYENFRQSYVGSKNPFDKGVLNNIKEFLFVPLPPSRVDFRAEVTPRWSSTAASVVWGEIFMKCMMMIIIKAQRSRSDFIYIFNMLKYLVIQTRFMYISFSFVYLI